jgi:MFS family permease
LATPFLGAFVFGVINITLLNKYFVETKLSLSGVVNLAKINPFYSFRQIYKAFGIKAFRALFVVSFLLSLGFSIFSNFFPKLLTDRFALSPLLLGSVISYFGIWVFGGVIICLPILNRYFKHFQSLFITLGVTCIFGLILSVITQTWGYFMVLPFIAIGIALSTPLLTTIISNQSPVNQQSKILGINTSLQALAATAPVIAGLIAVYSIELTIAIGFLIYGLAGLVTYLRRVEFDDSPSNI